MFYRTVNQGCSAKREGLEEKSGQERWNEMERNQGVNASRENEEPDEGSADVAQEATRPQRTRGERQGARRQQRMEARSEEENQLDEGDSTEIEKAVARENICNKNKYNDARKLPLREYLIKASFNTAYYVDISSGNIEQRIAEGYRFLDFDVFCASGGTVYVGFSKENAPRTGSTTLTFEQALECVAKNAFAKPKTSKHRPKKSGALGFFGLSEDKPQLGPSLYDNYIDYPIWVHIRVYRPPDSTTDVIANVAKVIKNAQIPGTFFLRNSDGTPTQINGCTSLDSIGKKIVFSVDIENVRQVYQPSDALSTEWTPIPTREAIRSFANVLTGGSTLPAFYRYTDDSLVKKTVKLGITDSKKLKTNAKYMYIVFPHPNDTAENPNVQQMVLSRSIQLIPVRSYLKDGNLTTYNEIFEDLKTPFAPLSYVYTKMNRND